SRLICARHSLRWKQPSGGMPKFRLSTSRFLRRRRSRMPKFSLPEGTPGLPPLRLPREPEHHGSGSWKVAYADFVTALMALFIVLWLMNSGDRVKKSVAGYFHDPRGYTRKLGAGPGGAGEGLQVHRANVNDVRGQIEMALDRKSGVEGEGVGG